MNNISLNKKRQPEEITKSASKLFELVILINSSLVKKLKTNVDDLKYKFISDISNYLFINLSKQRHNHILINDIAITSVLLYGEKFIKNYVNLDFELKYSEELTNDLNMGDDTYIFNKIINYLCFDESEIIDLDYLFNFLCIILSEYDIWSAIQHIKNAEFNIKKGVSENLHIIINSNDDFIC